MTGLLNEGKGWYAALGAAAVAGLMLLSSFARAAEPTLEVAVGGETRSFTRGDLLARPDAATIEVATDVAYGVPMTYRAVPVASLLAGLSFPPGSVIEAVAIDGFVAQIPLDLMLNTDPNKAVGWVAIEPADHPWPKIPGRAYTAGPFYIVWTGARGWQRSQRVLGLPGRQTRKPSLPCRALASTRGRCKPACDRSDPRRPDLVRRPMPALSQAEWRRRSRSRPRPQSAHESRRST